MDGGEYLMRECSLSVTLQTEDVGNGQTGLAALIDSAARIVETGLLEGPVFNAQGDQIGTYRLVA